MPGVFNWVMWWSCEDNVEQQEMEEDEVGKEEELGLWGGPEETNQNNAVCTDVCVCVCVSEWVRVGGGMSTQVHNKYVKDTVSVANTRSVSSLLWVLD